MHVQGSDPHYRHLTEQQPIETAIRHHLCQHRTGCLALTHIDASMCSCLDTSFSYGLLTLNPLPTPGLFCALNHKAGTPQKTTLKGLSVFGAQRVQRPFHSRISLPDAFSTCPPHLPLVPIFMPILILILIFILLSCFYPSPDSVCWLVTICNLFSLPDCSSHTLLFTLLQFLHRIHRLSCTGFTLSPPVAAGFPTLPPLSALAPFIPDKCVIRPFPSQCARRNSYS